MSPGELSEILRGVRPVTYKAATKIAKALDLNLAEKEHLLSLVRQSREQEFVNQLSGGLKQKAQEALRLSEDIFEVVSEWYHFAILNLMGCKGFRWNHSYLSSRLGISPTQAKMAMRQLMKLGLVQKQGERFVSSNERILTGDQIPSQAIRQYHQQMLEKAKEALTLQSLEQRDISGVGFACRTKDLPAIKKEISKFQDQMMDKYGTTKGDDVYQLEVAFFCVSQGDPND